MKKDTLKPEDFFTEAQLSAIASDALPVEHRLWWITDWLKESGSSPEALMLAYFNECMRVTTECRGLMGAYIMANQLHWHIVQLIRKLHTVTQSTMLSELPADSINTD